MADLNQDIPQIDYQLLAQALAPEIARNLKAMPPAEAVLWSVADCAEYYGVSTRHFIDTFSKLPGHPKPVIVSVSAEKPQRRWYMSEIIAHAKTRRSKSA